MAKDNTRAGGFCAVNSGTIKNCYSLVRVHAGRKKAGGFTGENNGGIHKSFSFLSLRGLLGGFTGSELGRKIEDKISDIHDCYFFHNEKKGVKRLNKLIDHELAQRLSEIEKSDDMNALGFDLEEIWQYTSEKDEKAKKHKSPLIFIPEKWLFDIRCTAKLLQYTAVNLTLYSNLKNQP